MLDAIPEESVRRAIEDLPAEQYDLPYFEKWACALANSAARRSSCGSLVMARARRAAAY